MERLQSLRGESAVQVKRVIKADPTVEALSPRPRALEAPWPTRAHVQKIGITPTFPASFPKSHSQGTVMLTCGAIPYPTPIHERLKSLPGPHSARTTIDRSPTVPLRFAPPKQMHAPGNINMEMSGEGEGRWNPIFQEKEGRTIRSRGRRRYSDDQVAARRQARAREREKEREREQFTGL